MLTAVVRWIGRTSGTGRVCRRRPLPPLSASRSTDPNKTESLHSRWRRPVQVAYRIDNLTVPLSLHRPRVVHMRALGVMAASVAPPIATALAAATYSNLNFAGLVLCVSFAFALLLINQLVRTNRAWIVATFLVGFLTACALAFVAPAMVLQQRGHEVNVTVVSVRTTYTKKYVLYYYKLQSLGGQPIPGELLEMGDDYTVGQGLAVVVDPYGALAPRTADEVDIPPAVQIAAGIGLLLTAVMGLITGDRRPAGPPPQPATGPVRVQRRASNTGVVTVAGQKIALGQVHAGRTVTIAVTDTTLTLAIEGDDDPRTFRRTNDQPGHQPKPVAPAGSSTP